MFIDTQPDLITAPEESNVAAVVNMALRWSANPVGGGCYKHLAAPRPNPTETNTLLPHYASRCADHICASPMSCRNYASLFAETAL